MKNQAPGGQSAACTDAYSWRRRIAMLLLAIASGLATQAVLMTIVGASGWTGLQLLMIGSVQATVLLAVAIFERRHSGGVRAVMGHDVAATFKRCFPWLVVSLLLCTGLDFALGYKSEPLVTTHGLKASMAQRVLIFTLVLTVLPLIEELLYRHFLIRLFPVEQRVWRYAAILATSALYLFVHQHQPHWTGVLLFSLIAVILAYARIRSAGLLAPVLLHSSVLAMGMVRGLLVY
ncbi:CPBP family intramembrane glutamic endopeptidase [Pseudomonas syringae]|nr:CPBP family intramembrane metalloprotease [Pseudomonas syringae]